MSQVQSKVNAKMKLHVIQTESAVYFLMTVNSFK